MLLPLQLPPGEVSDWQVGPAVKAPAGATGRSVTPTPVSASGPVLVTV